MSGGVAEGSLVRLAPGVVLREDHARGQWTLLGPERVVVLDEAALDVVRACTGGTATVAAGIEALARQYEAPRGDIAGDVLDLLNDLRDRGFVIA